MKSKYFEALARLDLHTDVYGDWVDTRNKKVYPVIEFESHDKVGEQILKRRKMEFSYQTMYNLGFVRVIYSKYSNELQFSMEGQAKALKKLWNDTDKKVLRRFNLIYLSCVSKELAPLFSEKFHLYTAADLRTANKFFSTL